MVGLFLLPRSYFIAGTFAVTGEMVMASYLLGGLRYRAWAPREVAVGVASAVILYAVFYAGNAGIHYFNLPGVGSAQQTSIYSLIASPSNPLALQLGVLLFDAAGYESYFRGTLQESLRARLGVGAAPAVALLDAGLHLATLNLLWVATTFVADLAWGITYHFGKGAPSSFTSHLVWDVAIFLIRPIA